MYSGIWFMSRASDRALMAYINHKYLAILVVTDFAGCRRPDGEASDATDSNHRRESGTEISAVQSGSEYAPPTVEASGEDMGPHLQQNTALDVLLVGMRAT